MRTRDGQKIVVGMTVFYVGDFGVVQCATVQSVEDNEVFLDNGIMLYPLSCYANFRLEDTVDAD